MPKKKAIAAATILGAVLFLIAAVSLAAAASSKIYSLREYAGGTLVWHRDETYLFLFESRVGCRINYVEYPWVLLGDTSILPPFPDDHRFLLTVIRVTPFVVERRVVEFRDSAGIFPNT